MTKNGFSHFSICLECKPHGTAPAWDASVARYYNAMLREIPDTDIEVLMFAIGTATDIPFRPEPADVLALWRKLRAPKAAMNAADAVAAILQAINEPQFREILTEHEVFVPDPGQEDAVKAHRAHIRECMRNNVPITPPPGVAAITGPYETRQETTKVRHFDMPQWVEADTTLSKIVAAMGGWPSISTGGAMGESATVFRGQLRRIAEAVIAGEGNEMIERLRLEYQAQRQLTAETPMLEEAA